MLDVVMLSIAIAAGVPIAGVVGLSIVLLAPLPLAALFLGAAALISMRRRPGFGADGESVFLRSVTAELGAGATLRMALVAATERVPQFDLSDWSRRASAGWPLADLAGDLGRQLPISGRATAAAIAFTSASGVAALEVFTGLAQQADDAIALTRERAVATAQARMSAMVVAGAPVPVLAWMLASGRLADLLASGAGRVVLGTGLGLEIAGVVLSTAILRRSRA